MNLVVAVDDVGTLIKLGIAIVWHVPLKLNKFSRLRNMSLC
jgi:hypothetical protein